MPVPLAQRIDHMYNGDDFGDPIDTTGADVPCHHIIRRLVCNAGGVDNAHWPEGHPYIKEDQHRSDHPARACPAPKDVYHHVARLGGVWRTREANRVRLMPWGKANDIVYFDGYRGECDLCTKKLARNRSYNARNRQGSGGGHDKDGPGGASGQKRRAGDDDAGSAGKKPRQESSLYDPVRDRYV